MRSWASPSEHGVPHDSRKCTSANKCGTRKVPSSPGRSIQAPDTVHRLEETNDMRNLSWLIAALLAPAALALGPLAEAADSIPQLKIRIADSYTKEMPSGVALQHFAKRISELSEGKMTAQIYAAGTLYSEDKGIQGVLDGTV